MVFMRRLFIFIIVAGFLLAGCADYQVPIAGSTTAADDADEASADDLDDSLSGTDDVEKISEEAEIDVSDIEVSESALTGAFNDEYKSAIEQAYKNIGIAGSGNFIRENFNDMKKLNIIDSPLGPRTVSMLYTKKGHTTFLYYKKLDITLGACYGMAYRFSKTHCKSPYY